MTDEELLLDFLMELNKINPEATPELHYTIYHLRGDEFQVNVDKEMRTTDRTIHQDEYSFANNYEFEGDILRELYLPGMNLSVLPDSINTLKSLKKLFIGNNHISHIPEGVSELTELEYFNMNNNLLKIIPDYFLELPNLKELHLGNNQLLAIPEELNKMPKLERLDLIDNPFTELPKPLMKNKKMKIRCAMRDDFEEEEEEEKTN